ncbi:MAG: bifunctional glutamate N-acetyltransferase/amino-acid acetyltransferase ArgJ [Pseudomonadota bacterium]
MAKKAKSVKNDGRETDAQLEKLESKLEKRRSKLAKARAKVKDLEVALKDDEAPARSPFAPDRFPDLPEIDGVRIATSAAGVKYKKRLDVMLAEVAKGSAIAGVFTKSRTRAAPVLWCEEKLAALKTKTISGPAAILVNAGNANAFTGDNGRKAVEETALSLTSALGVKTNHVFLASTGVIGEPLPYERITKRLETMSKKLAPGGWEPAAQAIMTTDTFPKGSSTVVEVDGAPVTIAGIAKGSGMIAPDMATMLVFLFTDVAIDPALLQKTLSDLTGPTFNSITVDGDTSTSDTLLLAATGKAGNAKLSTARSAGYPAFRRSLESVMRDLAQQVVKDGEGATKFVEVTVQGAKTVRAARRIALAIANSPLVKTAWAGEDPNWGRLIMAVGKAGEEANRDMLSIRYGPHPVAETGWRSPDYDEAVLAKYMRQSELQITVDVGVGRSSATVWTCDLTHQYISINADYRS